MSLKPPALNAEIMQKNRETGRQYARNQYLKNKERHNAYTKKYRKENILKIKEHNSIPKIKERANLKERMRNRNIRLNIIKKLSPNICCIKCGCNDLNLLQIDHINNDGKEDRKKRGYKHIIDLPNYLLHSKYQILCVSCHKDKHKFDKRPPHRENKHCPICGKYMGNICKSCNNI